MPLIQIRRNPTTVPDTVFKRLLESLPAITAEKLTCREGGLLKPEDIMIEVSDFGPYDLNCKDLHIRIYAHDYQSRRGWKLQRLDAIRKSIYLDVCLRIPSSVTRYVWILLSPTSYGSDTT